MMHARQYGTSDEARPPIAKLVSAVHGLSAERTDSRSNGMPQSEGEMLLVYKCGYANGCMYYVASMFRHLSTRQTAGAATNHNSVEVPIRSS